jgi:hypothetical protein
MAMTLNLDIECALKTQTNKFYFLFSLRRRRLFQIFCPKSHPICSLIIQLDSRKSRKSDLFDVILEIHLSSIVEN